VLFLASIKNAVNVLIIVAATSGLKLEEFNPRIRSRPMRAVLDF
jgi:hypothetical protein